MKHSDHYLGFRRTGWLFKSALGKEKIQAKSLIVIVGGSNPDASLNGTVSRTTENGEIVIYFICVLFWLRRSNHFPCINLSSSSRLIKQKVQVIVAAQKTVTRRRLP